MLRVTGLKKQFETDRGASVAAVYDVSFEVETGRLLTLLGPSGCGKTTTLRLIAGLEEPDGGEIQIGANVVFSGARRFSLLPNRRRVGMVFQSYAIWPHMTVCQRVRCENASSTFWLSSDWRHSSNARLLSYPGANNNGSLSRAHWLRSRKSCFSTSPCPI